MIFHFFTVYFYIRDKIKLEISLFAPIDFLTILSIIVSSLALMMYEC